MSKTRRSMSLLLLLPMLALLGVFGATLSRSALAAPNTIITVTNLNDSGAGSLRQAIFDAAAGDTIEFDAGLSGETISLSSELSIGKNLTISGNVPITISGNNSTRVFNVTAGNVTFDSLIIANGFVQTNDCGASSDHCGAGIMIQNAGVEVTVINSTFYGNLTNSRGGGIYNHQGTLTVNNSTLSDNEAFDYGGGIYNRDGVLTVNNSTLSHNRAYSAGGGIRNFNGSLHLRNTILANSTGSYDCASNNGPAGTNINNLIERNNGCGPPLLNANPLLASLQDNGGPTLSHALQPGSPTIDAGDNATCLATDQRGIARPQGTACDIGAYESRGFTLSLNGGTPQTTEISSSFAEPLALAVSSAFGEQVEGGQVAFSAPSSGAGLTFVNAVASIGSGGAVSLVVTANGEIGSYQVSANANGNAANSVTYNLRNVCTAGITVMNVNSSGPGSLRQAINDVPAGCTIDFDPSLSGDAIYVSPDGELVIDKSLTITGNVPIVIHGSDAVRVFNVMTTSTPTIDVTFDNLVIRDGHTQTTDCIAGFLYKCGGGIMIQDSSVTVHVNNSWLDNNESANFGGGIFNLDGTLTVNNSTFSYNRAKSGGAILNWDGTVTVNNSTLTYNRATDPGGIGGIKLNSTTTPLAELHLLNTILANSIEGDCLSPSGLTTNINNLIEQPGSCGTPVSTDDPILGSLQTSDGVYPLLGGSPAIDAGDDATCLPVDKRGVSRPQGTHCDIGSYEAINTAPVAEDDIDEIVFRDDGADNWVTSGIDPTWVHTTTNPHDGIYHWFAEDLPTISDQYLQLAAPILLDANSILSFWHWYATDEEYDGGVVEISINDGEFWSDLGAEMTKNGYNGTIDGDFGNPIPGRQAFVFDSGAYLETIVDLSGYAGENVLIRFRMATDGSVGGNGWLVDDVMITDIYHFTTDKNTSFTTGNVLDNDHDPDGEDEILNVQSFDTTGTIGLVTSNGDGTFNYDPNGQFSHLVKGQQAVDTFTYTTVDSPGLTDMATVTITITGLDAGPNPVSDLAIHKSGTDIVLEWTAVTTNTDGSAADIATYHIYRDTDPTVQTITALDSITGTTYLDTGAASGSGQFFYTVIAENTDDQTSDQSNLVGVFQFSLTPGSS